MKHSTGIRMDLESDLVNVKDLVTNYKKFKVLLFGQTCKSCVEKGDKKNGRLELVMKWEEFDGKRWVEKVEI